jgi:hypothetical protein
MEQEARLMGRLASWMEQDGQILYDRQQSNSCTGVRIREIACRGHTYRIIDVDGMTCRIERQ